MPTQKRDAEVFGVDGDVARAQRAAAIWAASPAGDTNDVLSRVSYRVSGVGAGLSFA
jgi:hypothetical protein